MEGVQYNEHVHFNMGDKTRDPLIRALDIFIGAFLVLCTLIGVPGNLVALRYFTTARKPAIPTYIYIAIASIDNCTGKLGARK